MASERFFLQTLPDDLGTEARKALQRKWIAELGELDHWTRAKVTKVRGFITERCDTYRDSYGRRTGDHPRHIVFIGTVNPPYMYLVDDAGGRRYWPVRLRYVKIAAVKKERAQLWAEALFRYRNGEPFHLVERELRVSARAVQEDRHQQHPWEEAIADFARIHPKRAQQGLSLSEFHEVLRLSPDKQTRSTGQQIIACITRLGFQKVRYRVGGVRPRTWVLPVDKKLTKDRMSSISCPSDPEKAAE
jgi:putative DNA primase/helicase